MPTFKELGLDAWVATGWFGFFGPANMTKPVVDVLNSAINKPLRSPDVIEKLSKIGMDPRRARLKNFWAPS